MNKIINSIILSGAVLATTSCSDYLDQYSPSEQNTQVVFESTYYTGLTVNKLYGLMNQDATYSQYIPIIWGLNSDCELVDGLGDNAYNTTSERGNMNYNSNPGWNRLPQVWNAMYGIIENANLVIEGVEGSALANTGSKTDRTTMLRYKGEALVIRAMVYHDLIRFFGDIPMKMESSQADLSNAYLGKTDRDVIMDSLIVDLEEAVELLPWAGQASGYTTERVTKGYAHALLANVALTRAGYAIREKAIDGYVTATENSDPTYPTQRCSDEKRKEMYEKALVNLSAIISAGVHQLTPSVGEYWDAVNKCVLDETYRENIFEIAMGLGTGSELGYTVGVRINGASQRYGDKGNSSGKLKLTAPFFWSFDKKDQRRDITCAMVDLKEESGVLMERILGNTPFGIYCGKWDIRKMSEEWRQMALAQGNAKWLSGINVTRMRYPHVLLMYAEVLNELAGPDGSYEGAAGITAREALAQVHTRAFAAADKGAALEYVNGIAGKEALFSAIVDENAWELAGEGLRKFDLIRWNLLSAKIDQFKADYEAQLPEYPEKVYFNYSDEAKSKIDMSSITWYETPEDITAYHDSKTFFGAEYTDAKKQQLLDYLPSISSGLNSEVLNRHLLPIGSTTISAANGMLKNSYGFTD